jgi:hypothetical protein
MNKTKIKDLLKGYSINQTAIQSIANMTVVPIVSDTEYSPIADISNIKIKRDIMYNEIEFENIADNIGILLQGYTIFSYQKAQDRTIPYAHLIKSRMSKRIPANCVQQSQCGLLNEKKLRQEEFRILPTTLRARALIHSTFTEAETSALWDDLDHFSPGIDTRRDGLISFYNKFKIQLDEFVASFEPVNKQLGSIVLINDQIAAFDIVPNYKNWLFIYRSLIRDSYAAEAIRAIQNKKIKSLISIIDEKEVTSIFNLEQAYKKSTESFYKKINDIIEQNIELEVNYKALDQIADLNLVKIKSQQFIGCAVFHGQHIIYLSLVAKSLSDKTIEDFEKIDKYSDKEFEV